MNQLLLRQIYYGGQGVLNSPKAQAQALTVVANTPIAGNVIRGGLAVNQIANFKVPLWAWAVGGLLIYRVIRGR